MIDLPRDSLEYAVWFVQTYCPHWATLNNDWQTLDGTMRAYAQEAQECFNRLEAAGRIRWAERPPRLKPWRSGKPNFLILPEEGEKCQTCRK